MNNPAADGRPRATERAGVPAPWDQPARDVPNRMAILAVMLVGGFVILLDATIVNVAIPTVQRSLHASDGAIEWIVSGYALAYGLLLIPAGRLGDRIGHKRTYLIGLAGFTAASVLCGTCATAGELVAWRVVQGAMAGLMNPPILAIIQAIFPRAERGKAFGLYGAVAGLATALGPLAGGLLIAWNLNGWDWRPVFLVNLPIGIAGLAAAARIVPESRGKPDSLDLAGIGLVSAAMVLITYPLIEGPGAGWAPWTFACLASALPVLALFAWWEAWTARRGKTPLVNMSLFASRSFAAGTLVSLVYFAGFVGFLFVLSLYLQVGLGWSALHAGLAILPFAAGTFAGAACSDPIATRIGRGVLQVGSIAVALATLAVILIIHAEGAGVSALALLPALLAGGVGSGLVIAPNVEFVLSGVPWQDAGSASGVLNTSQRLGQAVGVAVVGVALFTSLGAAAPHGAPQDAAGQQALARAFTHATQVASLYALGAIAGTALLIPLLPRRARREGQAS
jgi:EmrB/QacA subfamily drug resistance transporter